MESMDFTLINWDEFSGASSPHEADVSPSSSWDELSDMIATSPESLAPSALLQYGTECGSGTSIVIPDTNSVDLRLDQVACPFMQTENILGSYEPNFDVTLDATRCESYLPLSPLDINPQDHLTLDMSTPFDLGANIQQPTISLPLFMLASPMESFMGDHSTISATLGRPSNLP